MTERSGKEDPAIRIMKNGPYIVSGGIPLSVQVIVCDTNGEAVGWREGKQYPVEETYALCRCGRSRTSPFCDGTHLKIHFNGTETASRVPYLERAAWIDGPDLQLTDAPGFCSHARFCVRGRGIWDLTEHSDRSPARETVIEMAAHCHSGRLVTWDKKSGKPIEPVFEKSIGLVEGPVEGRNGPLWVRGGIPVIASDGFVYEIRNRMTLCRCGMSHNKPFCDGSHLGRYD
jgi:CDGSH-type Zn-finger protein